jgi:SOS-response transcriptional repressor LexA
MNNKKQKSTSVPTLVKTVETKLPVTKHRAEILGEYVEYITTKGYVPSIREFAEAGSKPMTPSAMVQHFQSLANAGYLHILKLEKSVIAYIPVGLTIKVPKVKVLTK